MPRLCRILKSTSRREPHSFATIHPTIIHVSTIATKGHRCSIASIGKPLHWPYRAAHWSRDCSIVAGPNSTLLPGSTRIVINTARLNKGLCRPISYCRSLGLQTSCPTIFSRDSSLEIISRTYASRRAPDGAIHRSTSEMNPSIRRNSCLVRFFMEEFEGDVPQSCTRFRIYNDSGVGPVLEDRVPLSSPAELWRAAK